MVDISMPGRWFEEEIRRRIQDGEGFDFEDLIDLVTERNVKMEKLAESFGPSDLRLPPVIARGREDILELVGMLIEHYQSPAILGDTLALAVKITAQAAPLGDERIKEALNKWFCLIEEDDNLGDNDLAPKLVFSECRKTLF